MKQRKPKLQEFGLTFLVLMTSQVGSVKTVRQPILIPIPISFHPSIKLMNTMNTSCPLYPSMIDQAVFFSLGRAAVTKTQLDTYIVLIIYTYG